VLVLYLLMAAASNSQAALTERTYIHSFTVHGFSGSE